jgi:hypothetical protein
MPHKLRPEIGQAFEMTGAGCVNPPEAKPYIKTLAFLTGMVHAGEGQNLRLLQNIGRALLL